MSINKEKSNIKISHLIENLPQLPSMPTVISQALNIIDNPKANINQLAEIISKDMSITTQILKMVNSAYYGFPSQITSINKAMALLGFTKVKSLILSVAIKPMMMSQTGKVLWEHSIRSAAGAQHIAQSLGMGDSDEAFIMGLLHDIGKTILQVHNKDAFKEVLRLVSIGADVLTTERTFFGFTHTEIGKALVEKWRLPLIIGLSVEFHHNPLDSDDKLYPGIVYIADRITREQLKFPVFEQEVIDSFDFEIPDTEALREEIFQLSQPIIDALSK